MPLLVPVLLPRWLQACCSVLASADGAGEWQAANESPCEANLP